jgi:hypothetical protein
VASGGAWAEVIESLRQTLLYLRNGGWGGEKKERGGGEGGGLERGWGSRGTVEP